MTLNLTELKDEPLGKHPIQAAFCVVYVCQIPSRIGAEQDVIPADHESSFTFDVEGLGDEALDDSPSVSAFAGLPSYGGSLGDEVLDSIPRNAAVVCYVSCRGLPPLPR